MAAKQLAEAAVVYGRIRNIPAIVDVRDLWPDETYPRILGSLRAIGRLLLGGMEHSVHRTMTGAHSLCAVSAR